jgi:glycosyltransferase involved in cell wall biosynthesis
VADVILPGMRSDPLRYLRLGRVFVMPSRYEGLPNALIESLAAGVNVLASDCCWGPRSILSAGSLPYDAAAPVLPLALAHGVLMPLPDAAGAVQVWATEMARVLASPPAPRADRAARLACVARYDIGRTGLRWLKLAEEMAHLAGPR